MRGPCPAAASTSARGSPSRSKVATPGCSARSFGIFLSASFGAIVSDSAITVGDGGAGGAGGSGAIGGAGGSGGPGGPSHYSDGGDGGPGGPGGRGGDGGGGAGGPSAAIVGLTPAATPGATVHHGSAAAAAVAI
jgi:hypothetical protein